MISEDRLREIIGRVLTELEAKQERQRKKVYMLCTSQWDERYLNYLKKMEQEPDLMICPVIPISWKKKGYEDVLRSCPSCRDILYRSCQRPGDLDQSVTVFPAVPRDMVVKVALCISDTFETAWITDCITAGSRVIFTENSLARFSGKEPKAYVHQILSYYKTLLTYGIEIFGNEDGTHDSVPASAVPPCISDGCQTIMAAADFGLGTKTDTVCQEPPRKKEKKRVITASNVSQFANHGILLVSSDDVVTDLAKDRAKFLKIKLVRQDREVRG